MIKSAKKEYIFDIDRVSPACHASTVLPLDDGRVLAAWFGGKKEKDDDVEIYLAERSKNGVWSAPRIVSENDSIPHWNPVLYERENGEIILYYKYGKEIPDWITKYIVSADGGRTWSVWRCLNISGSPPHLLKHSSGALVCVFGRREAPFGERAIVSYDNGETWADEYVLDDRANDGDLGYPASVELDDGSILTVYYQKFPGDGKCSILYTKWKLQALQKL